MTLTINQSNGIIEEVNTSIINKLYNICIYNDNHNQNDYLLNGRLHSLLGYKSQADYLTNKFKNRLYITIDSYYVWFEDAEIRHICSENFSSDGIGVTQADIQNISYGEQSNSPYKNNTIIEHFDEFNLFTSAVRLPAECFINCSNLKTINLENVTRFGTWGGMQDSHTFEGCTSLQKIYAPKLSYVGVFAFSGCISLKYIVLPLAEDPARTDGRWIHRCDSLEYILMGKLHSCGAGGQWSSGIFCANINLKVVDLGDELNEIGAFPFKDCSNMKAIIIRNTEYIPIIYDYGDWGGYNERFGNSNVKFFVSDNLLNTYKSSTYWLEARNNIYPISTFKLSDYIDFEIPEVEDLYNSLYVEP